ncbi:MAG: hypothetical protein EA340_00585 [Nitriliruptor sp.]|nr:MAG: hypothetical protein EA340_00585 [Nitriliruptor sp.]
MEVAGDTADVRSRVEFIDGIIVTQSCDLENSKVANILLARVITWADFAAAQFAAGNTAVKSGSFRRNLIRGDIPPLMLLHARQPQPPLDWSVVDFRELHVVDRARIDEFVDQPGSRRRLRLLPPYKEHFAQAFARFYMRVGLPHDARAFETDGAADVESLG